MLHFKDRTASIHRHDAQDESKRLLTCGKHLTYQALAALDASFGDAKSRAVQLDRKHLGDGSPPRSNPSTNLWEFVERITDGN